MLASPLPSQPACFAACLNCGAALAGPFCAQCGQSAHTHRFTAAHLLHELPHSVWHVDRGLPYTIKEMLVRPGRTMRRYLAGQRVDLFRPVALVLLLAGVASFLLLALHLERIQPGHPPVTPAEHKTAAAGQLVFKHFAWFTLALLPLYALLSWAMLRRLRYNFVEHFMANAFVFGGALVLQMALLPPMAWAKGTPWLTPLYFVETFSMPVYQVWALATFSLGPYRLAGSLWRAFVIAVVGLFVSSFLIQLIAGLLVNLMH